MSTDPLLEGLEDVQVPEGAATERQWPRWRLDVEDFGAIRKASVCLAPLTVLVGENNSGKSYLATLLYGLHRYLEEIIADAEPPSVHDLACLRWVREHIVDQHTSSLSPEGAVPFWARLNELLARRGSELVARAFNRKGLSIGKLSLKALASATIKADYSELDVDDPVSSTTGGTVVRGHGSVGVIAYRRPDEDCVAPVDLITDELTRLIVDPDERDPLYLPASRTGFMLLFPDVVKRDIGRRKISSKARDEPVAELTAPMIEFLQFLATGAGTRHEGPHRDLADALEAQLHGSLRVAPGPGVHQYMYMPEEGTSLPMALASSLVTELAPIIVALRHKDLGFLVIEEPEAHLHPRLQCVVARLLVRLVRRGVRVCVTTHSELFCQQLNNLLKLGELRARGEERIGFDGYGDDEYLDPTDVAAYEFRRDASGTEVVALETSPDGIAMPLFNAELLRLAGETVDMQRKVDAVQGAS